MATRTSTGQIIFKAIFPLVDRRLLLRRSAVFFGVLGLALGIGSYLIIGNLTPISASRETVWTLLSFNVFAVAGLIAVLIGQPFVAPAIKRARAGARLHGRMVALLPPLRLFPQSLFPLYLVTFDRGLDHWFSNRTKTIINNTTAVANAYLTDQRDSLRCNATAVATDIMPVIQALSAERNVFWFSQAQAAIRNMPQALIIDREAMCLWQHRRKRLS